MSGRDRSDIWGQTRDVLCVRLDAMGDVLMTTPALRAVEKAGAGRRVTLLTSPAGAEVAALLPMIGDVIVYDAPWMKATAPRSDSQPDLAMIERLRARQFDAAIVFTVYSQNPMPPALLCYLADIPLRLAHCRENPYQLLTDWIPEPEPEGLLRHEVRRQLDLVAAVGFRSEEERLTLHIPDRAALRVECLLEGLNIDPGRPWVIIHPGSTAPSRRYPPEGFAAAARRLAVEDGLRVVFTGGEAERPLIDEIRRAMGVPSDTLAGTLDLGELAALITRAPLLICNNTGPAHVAAAMGTPVVDLYALTNLQHTPWAVPQRVLFHDVPCRLCYRSVCPEGHHRCLRLVPPEAIVEAARALLYRSGPFEVSDLFPELPPPFPRPTPAPRAAS